METSLIGRHSEVRSHLQKRIQMSGRSLKPCISLADGENQRVMAVAIVGPRGHCSGRVWMGYVIWQDCTVEGSHGGRDKSSKRSGQLSLLACLPACEASVSFVSRSCVVIDHSVFCSCICMWTATFHFSWKKCKANK